MSKLTLNAKTLEALASLILANPAMAAKLGVAGAKASAKRPAKPVVGSAEKKLAFAEAAVAAAKARGFSDAKANENLFTYRGWEAKGFRVKTGEKSIRVKTKGMKGNGVPLFHKSQVEIVTA